MIFFELQHLNTFIIFSLPPLAQNSRPSDTVILQVIPTTSICLWVAFYVNHIFLLSIRVIVSLPPVEDYYVYNLST